jgi:hypothetical protein
MWSGVLASRPDAANAPPLPKTVEPTADPPGIVVASGAGE